MQTALIGIAGLLATVATSIAGLYFTARARTAPLREHLYRKQLDLTEQILRTVGRAKVYAAIAFDGDEDNPFRHRALDDLGATIAELSRLSDSAAALLPTRVYVEVAVLTRLLTDFASALDAGDKQAGFPEQFAGQAGKLALLIRSVWGVDELSAESVGLFGSSKDLEKLSSISPEALLRSISHEPRR